MKASIIRSITLLFLAVAATTALKAQTENTSERLITQLKNGTAPGLVFSNEKPVQPPSSDNKVNQKESLIAQIRKGKAPGMQFKPVTGAPVMARAATAAAPTQPLTSEQPAARPEPVKPAAAMLPKQE